MRPIFSLAILFLLLCTAACQPILPTDGAASDQSSAHVLYRDDFSNPESGWRAAANPGGRADYADGVFRITLDQPNSDAWASPGLDLSDVRVDVEAIKAGGDRNNRFGILCRVTSPARYYIFMISSDGYYGIGKVNQGQYELLGSQSLLPSDKIPQGSEYLRLRADCVQDRLALYVNEQLITEVMDAEFESGDVGLIAGSYQTAGVDILFDNFTVARP